VPAIQVEAPSSSAWIAVMACGGAMVAASSIMAPTTSAPVPPYLPQGIEEPVEVAQTTCRTAPARAGSPAVCLPPRQSLPTRRLWRGVRSAPGGRNKGQEASGLGRRLCKALDQKCPGELVEGVLEVQFPDSEVWAVFKYRPDDKSEASRLRRSVFSEHKGRWPLPPLGVGEAQATLRNAGRYV
jgi:hypothetical protein